MSPCYAHRSDGGISDENRRKLIAAGKYPYADRSGYSFYNKNLPVVTSPTSPTRSTYQTSASCSSTPYRGYSSGSSAPSSTTTPPSSSSSSSSSSSATAPSAPSTYGSIYGSSYGSSSGGGGSYSYPTTPPSPLLSATIYSSPHPGTPLHRTTSTRTFSYQNSYSSMSSSRTVAPSASASSTSSSSVRSATSTSSASTAVETYRPSSVFTLGYDDDDSDAVPSFTNYSGGGADSGSGSKRYDMYGGSGTYSGTSNGMFFIGH
ncbi:hypothetical protein GQ42DRAFT_164938 [Ramicandelaber brevisporus]|nr:hypothetical protein GQ42DRAFT_164938 [Ramicandelaber brevisporus]